MVDGEYRWGTLRLPFMAKVSAFKSTVVDALETASSAVEELIEEMTSWRDNLDSANMSHLPKYDAVSECVDALEGADAGRRTEELLATISLCAEGRAFRAGCPEHVVGTPCKRCKWGGTTRAYAMPVLVEHPLETKWVEWQKKHVTDVATIGSCKWQVAGEHPRQEEIDAELRRARSEWWKQAEGIARLNAVPARISDENAEEPIVGAEALDASVEYRCTGKRRPSRADRLGDAQGMFEAALDSIDKFLGEFSTDGLSGFNLDRLEDVRRDAKDLREGVDELSGIEFPGMFG